MKHEEPGGYFIDTCSLTQLRRTYPREIFPQVWLLIEELAEQGRLLSVEDVFLETQLQDDEIAVWTKKWRRIFLPLSEKIQLAARAVLAAYPTLIDYRKSGSADPFLVAAASLRNATVVTEEVPSGGSTTRVKIPDVCHPMKVRCITLLDLLRAEKLRSDQRE